MDAVVLVLFGNSWTVVLVAACCIDFPVVGHCTGLDIGVGIAQPLVLFAGEQGSVSL